MKKANLPNFLIVGAAKSGTTSLYHYLKEHPEIFLSTRKELRFFSDMKGKYQGPGDEQVNNTIVSKLEEYKLYFNDVGKEKAIGDISPDYLFFYQNSIKNIKDILGQPKIIIILRNPINRAFSHYLHFVRDGRENLSFEEALAAIKRRQQSNWEWAWFYINVGFYYNQVKAYLDNFSKVKIILFDDLKQNPLKVVQDIYRFLGVDDSFVPKSLNSRFNVSGVPKNKFIHNIITKPNTIKSIAKSFLKLFLSDDRIDRLAHTLVQHNLQKPTMKPETRKYLRDLYYKDILKLQKLINKDLSHWLEV